MKITKTLKHAFKMVVHSKLRSWLTILGIVIGVASVIAIVSFGDGMEASISNELGSLGTDLVTVSPGVSKAQFVRHGKADFGGVSASDSDQIIGRSDLQVIKGISGIELIETEIDGNVDIYFLGESGSVSLTGVDQKVWSKITTEEIEDGRILGTSDQNVIVIGDKLANDYFENQIGINKIITIEDKAFRVVGVLSEGSGNNIYMPISASYELIEDSVRDEYNSIIIKVKEGVNLEEFVENLEYRLRLSRHVTEKEQDFTVRSNAASAEMRNTMIGTMTTFLTAIAAISLIVGAVGVANTMFTSVIEKTKEIGIMKAIGAKNNDILFIFLFNAAIIGLIGGIVGLGLGYVLSAGMAAMMGVETIITIQTIAMALGVSIGVGLISGLIPAYQASQQNPVDALRSE